MPSSWQPKWRSSHESWSMSSGWPTCSSSPTSDSWTSTLRYFITFIIYLEQTLFHLSILGDTQQYVEQAQELINNENILLQTLGFDVAIDHPHTQVLKCCQHLFRGNVDWYSSSFSKPVDSIFRFYCAASSKDMAQTSYFMATNR